MSISVTKLESSCEDVSRILKSLAHPQRLMVMGHLCSGRKTVGELVQLCEISQSQMSQFLTRLSYEGLIECEPEGKFRYYTISDKRLQKVLEILQKEYCPK